MLKRTFSFLFLVALFQLSYITMNAQTFLKEDWSSGQFSTNQWTTNSGNGFITISDEGTAYSKAVSMGHNSTQQGIDSVTLTTKWYDASGITKGILLFKFNYRLLNPDTTRWPLLKIYCDNGTGWQKLYEMTFDSTMNWQEIKTSLEVAKGHQFRLMWVAAREADTAYGTWLIDDIVVEAPSNETYFPLNASHDSTSNSHKVKLKWQSPRQSNLTDALSDSTIKFYSNPNPVNLFCQNLKWGYGSCFDNRIFKTGFLYEVNFHHSVYYNFKGRSRYKLHLVNVSNKEILKTFGPFTTTKESGWERNIPLNLVQYENVDTIAVLLEPLDYNGDVCMPAISQGVSQTITNNIVLMRLYYDVALSILHDNFQALVDVKVLTSEGKFTSLSPISYEVNRWEQSIPLNYTTMATVDSSSYSFTDDEVSPNWYSYYITAKYADGNTINSDTTIIQVPTSQAIKELDQNRVTVYPNPLRGRTLQFTNPQVIQSITIKDMLGRTVYSTENREQVNSAIHLSDIPAGNYVIQILLTDNKWITNKLIVL